ncbi:MAG TPA: hypothetical protein VGJ07_26275 [Rugosimonospora sp.]
MGERGREVETVITAKMQEDFGRAAADRTLGAATARFGRTTATRLAAMPDHPGYSKARGFSIDDADHLDAICAFFTDAGLAPLIEVWAGDASAALGRRLAQAGFYAAEVNATLRARPGPLVPPATPDPDVEIREVAPGDDAGYLETLIDGYGLGDAPPAARRMLTVEHRSPHLRRYLAWVGGRPAAAAALYLTPRVATPHVASPHVASPRVASPRFATPRFGYLAGAATIPAMRNRGCQSALIRRRLQDAAVAAAGTAAVALDCAASTAGAVDAVATDAAAANPAPAVVVTTAFGSPSQANLQRLGFTIVHTRTLWRPY